MIQPSASKFSDALLAAFDRRAALHADPAQTAYRLFHGQGEGCPGLTVDRLGPALVVTHRPELEAVVEEGLKPLVPRLVVMKLVWGKSQPRVVHGLPVDDRNLVREDLYEYLRRGKKKGLAVDGVILDPPPMVPGRDPKGQACASLTRLAAPLLAPGGWLLCFFHRRERSRADCEQEVSDASQIPLEVLHRGTSGDDFPETDPEARFRFTAFVRPRRAAPVS